MVNSCNPSKTYDGKNAFVLYVFHRRFDVLLHQSVKSVFITSRQSSISWCRTMLTIISLGRAGIVVPSSQIAHFFDFRPRQDEDENTRENKYHYSPPSRTREDIDDRLKPCLQDSVHGLGIHRHVDTLASIVAQDNDMLDTQFIHSICHSSISKTERLVTRCQKKDGLLTSLGPCL
jgi:hypothetical protein